MKRLAVVCALALALSGCGHTGIVATGTWSSVARAWPQGTAGIYVGEVDAGSLLGSYDEVAGALLGWVSGLLGIGVSLDQVVVTRPLVSLREANRARSLDVVSGFTVPGAATVVWADDGPVGAVWFGPASERGPTAAALRLALGSVSYRR